MRNNLEIIRANLVKGQSRGDRTLRSPYLYFDSAAVMRIFRDLTGLSDPGKISMPGDGNVAGDVLTPAPPSNELLFEAMAPIIEEDAPRAESAGDLEGRSFNYLRIGGTLETTRFPDGNLNLELSFGGVRGLLFFTKSCFDSLVRPVLFQDRLHWFSRRVEALVYSVGDMAATIFYHQTYGDNQEHQWLPLVPVVLREAGLDPDGSPAYRF